MEGIVSLIFCKKYLSKEVEVKASKNIEPRMNLQKNSAHYRGRSVRIDVGQMGYVIRGWAI